MPRRTAIALLLPVALAAAAGAARADVIPPRQDEPQDVGFMEEVGAFQLVVTHYAPHLHARPPFRPPYGLEEVSLEWTSPDGTARVRIWDNGEALRLVREPVPLTLGEDGRLACHQVGPPLPYAALRSPERFWRDNEAGFDRWYRRCHLFRRAPPAAILAGYRQAEGSVGNGVRRLKAAVRRGFGWFPASCLRRAHARRPAPSPARPACLADTRGATRPPADLCAATPAAQPPADFGSHGVQGQYSFVTQRAPRHELGEFLRKVSDARFSFVPITINLNGFDTLIVPGREALRTPADVEREYRAVCGLRTGHRIYLVHARYNLTTEQRDQVRVR